MIERVQQFDFSVDLMSTILWQHEGSPNIIQLTQNDQDFLNRAHEGFWNDWVKDVFDLTTANVFGLNVWSRILDFPISIDGEMPTNVVFGFGTLHENFENGNFMAREAAAALDPETARKVLMLRWFKLTMAPTVPNINRSLDVVFGDGLVKVVDQEDMSIVYTFSFDPEYRLRDVLNRADALPRPSGVKATWQVDENWPIKDLPWHTLIVPSEGVTLDGLGGVSQIDDLSGNGHHFTQATASSRPTIATGAHGKPVLLFDGIDDCLKSASALTCPTNYIVWTAFRLTSLPSETSGLRHHVWSMSSSGGTANVETLDISGSGFLEAEVANTNEQSTGYAMAKTVQVVASVATYPSVEVRVNNASVATIGPGTRIPPVEGPVVIGGTVAENVGRFVYMELSAFGVLDADELGADLEATLAHLQQIAEINFGV